MAYNHQISQKLFELAKEVIPVKNARIVAAITHKGKIIALGCNSYKTHPRAVELQGSDNKPCLHAEMNAIFQAEKLMDSLKDCELYVIRAKKIRFNLGYPEWVYGISKPCIGCEKLIKSLGIKVIYCSKSDRKIGDITNGL